MKKVITFSLIGLALFLVGCNQQTTDNNQNLNQSAVNQNQNTNQVEAKEDQNLKASPITDTNPTENQETAEIKEVENAETPEKAPSTLKTFTYRTDAYGFEVKHPSTWTVSKTGDQNGGYANFMSSNKNGADVCLVLFGYPSMTISQAEKVLPVLSVSGRKIDSRTKVTINNIIWDKLVIGNQIVLLTAKNYNVYGAQYSTTETECSQILSSYRITN